MNVQNFRHVNDYNIFEDFHQQAYSQQYLTEAESGKHGWHRDTTRRSTR